MISIVNLLNTYFTFQFNFACANTLKFRVQDLPMQGFTLWPTHCLHTFAPYPRCLGLSRPWAGIMLTTPENKIGFLSISGLCGSIKPKFTNNNLLWLPVDLFVLIHGNLKHKLGRPSSGNHT